MFFLKRELRRLRRRLDDIISTDTNARLTTATSDKDVAALAISINSMLERSRLTIIEKNHAEAALKSAVTNISHDLRTPLTSALGYLQLLESIGLDDDTKARYIDVIKGRLDVLATLMNSLFEFARLIEEDNKLDICEVNICNLLRDELSESYLEFESRGFTVDINIPDTPEIRLCNEDALRRVLQNLMKNAYTHGREYLSVCLDADSIVIANKASLHDGFDVDRLFERFYTADASRTGKNTGLGLAIAKELTKLMGGQITAALDGDLLVVKVSMARPAAAVPMA